MNEFETIKATSGATNHSCSCATCQNMCKRSPCIGTPADIVRLINNGYIHQLALSTWSVGKMYGFMPDVDMVQLRLNDDSSCPMFKNGLCSIHAIKPTDGKLATHETRLLETDRARIPRGKNMAGRREPAANQVDRESGHSLPQCHHRKTH